MLSCLRFAAALILAMICSTAHAGNLSDAARQRLLAAYPDQLERIDGNTLIWRDGTRMPLDDGKGEKTFKDWLAHPDIEDMLAVPYPLGDVAPPPKDVDPGRARNAAFFDKVYGNCRKGEVEKNLTSVVWLPKKKGQRLPFNKINGAAHALQAVSRELDALPARYDVYLFPSAGTYNCRPIAGTKRMSAHGYAIAIDIALKHSDYWRNTKPGKDGAYAYRNEIPMEIVHVFERHGFIWGGKWHHYDTMHFEYRPELVGRGG
jgi:D-alanyl-D-alanine carboxypeptidase